MLECDFDPIDTVCPISSDPFYVLYKWITTSWTYSTEEATWVAIYLHEENMLDDVVDPRIQRLVNSATRIISVPTVNHGPNGQSGS